MDSPILLTLSYGLNVQNTIGFFLPILMNSANVLTSLLILYTYADKSAHYNKVKFSTPDAYDYIIVGGGVSGSIVAHRLAKNNFRVLLIERGGEPHPLSTVPALDLELLPKLSHRYELNGDNSTCQAMKDKKCVLFGGNSLGGSSEINNMLFNRGHPYDFDIWAEWTGDPRWSYKNLLPYFMKGEHFCHKCGHKNVNQIFHGDKGEHFLDKPHMANLIEEFLDGMSLVGAPRRDLNAPFSKSGADYATYTEQFGRRMGAREAFINPMRKKLHILKYARAYKVNIEGANAVSVSYEQFGELKEAVASREIILSAGAIETPKLLMLSGIGDAEHLTKLGIPAIINRPQVGLNFQSDVGTIIGPIHISQPLSYLLPRNFNLQSASEWLQNGTGPYSMPSVQALGYLSSTLSSLQDYPDIKICLNNRGLSSTSADILSNAYNIERNHLQNFKTTKKYQDAFNILLSYTRPRSRGSIRLASKSYRDDPIITPNYLEVDQDLKVLTYGMKSIEALLQTPVFKNLKATFPHTCSYECHLRNFTVGFNTYGGTCRMGGDSDSVVDSELKVKGLKNLRVIDHSIVPFLTVGGGYAASVVVGERGAAFLLESGEEAFNEPGEPLG